MREEVQILSVYLAVNDGREGDKGKNESKRHKENTGTKADGPMMIGIFFNLGPCL